MATIPFSLDRQVASQDDSVIVATWTGFAASGDVGVAIPFSAWSDKTWVITGSFTGSLGITWKAPTTAPTGRR